MTYHHLSVLVHRQAEKYGDKVALKYRDYETAQWIPISWKQFSGTVRQAANAFVALGVEEQENVFITWEKSWAERLRRMRCWGIFLSTFASASKHLIIN